MSGYRESAHSRETTEGDWVDFPASPDPDPWGTLMKKADRLAPGASGAHHWDAERVGGLVVMSLAVAFRGMLVTTAAVAIVAFLLLTNSHI